MGVGLGGSTTGGYGSSPWWTPTQSGYYDQAGITPVGRRMEELSPETAWYRYARELGIPDDQSAFTRWFRGQFPNYQLGYQAYTTENPLTANIQDYTASLGGFGDWMRRFNLQDPRLRGLDYGNRGGSPSRWIAR